MPHLNSEVVCLLQLTVIHNQHWLYKSLVGYNDRDFVLSYAPVSLYINTGRLIVFKESVAAVLCK